MPTRNYRQLDDLPPSWLAEYPSATTNQHTALALLLPRQIAALSAPPRTFSRRIKPFPPILHIPTHHESTSQALKTPHSHTAQQPTKTRHIRPKHPLTSTKTQPFAASIVGQTPRFRKTKRAELSIFQPCHGEKDAIKWNHYPKPPKNPIPIILPNTRIITLQWYHTIIPITLHYNK